jgi:hypothetical protein
MINKKFRVLMTLTALFSMVALSAASAPVGEETLPLSRVSQPAISLFSVQAQETSPCLEILLEVAQLAGYSEIFKSGDYGSSTGCYLNNRISGENNAFLSIQYRSINFPQVCVMTPSVEAPLFSFHGHDALTSSYTNSLIEGWTEGSDLFIFCMNRGGITYTLTVSNLTTSIEKFGPAVESLPIAEIFWSVAEKRLPLPDAPLESTALPDIVVMPNETTPPDNQPEEEIVTTGSFEETWQSPQAEAVRSPIIPIAGGLIGAGLAWLLAQSAAQATSYAVPLAAAVYAPPPASPPVIAQTPPVLTTEPPKLVTTPPELVTTPPILQSSPPTLVTEPPPLQTEAPPAKPVEPPEGPAQMGFDLVKDTIGTTGTLLGIYEKFLTDPNSLKTVNVIKDAVNTLTQTPAAEAVTEYVADVAKVTAAETAARIGEKLDVAGKFLDTAEALVNAEKICAERGYLGMDAVMRTYAEVGKKGVVWLITKNPVVGLADAAVGGATSMVFGAANKVDIGVAVDKTFEAWDNVSRHASNRLNRSFETAAEGQKAENLKHLTERIRQQVEGGKVSKLEGTRRLQRVLDKFNQESPLL